MDRFNDPLAPNTSPEKNPEQSRSISWKKALAIGAVPLVLLFSAAFQSPNSVPAQLQAILAKLTDLADKGPRKFYVTQTFHNGAQALSACAEGYHMASLYEIHDPSNLRYDTELGFTRADSGFGPPSFLEGWIRTGYSNSQEFGAGLANCNAWTSAVGGTNYGTTASLMVDWQFDSVSVSPWVGLNGSCNNMIRVWCVQD